MFATGPPALEALAPYAPTPLRLARPLARTTRTRNETETDFPIELIPSISDVPGLADPPPFLTISCAGPPCPLWLRGWDGAVQAVIWAVMP